MFTKHVCLLYTSNGRSKYEKATKFRSELMGHSKEEGRVEFITSRAAAGKTYRSFKHRLASKAHASKHSKDTCTVVEQICDTPYLA